MKQIPKKTLDALIHFDKMYWCDGGQHLLEANHALAFEIEDQSGLNWLAIKDFISSIFIHRGISPNADNETIYEALKLFGWEVYEVQESESV